MRAWFGSRLGYVPPGGGYRAGVWAYTKLGKLGVVRVEPRVVDYLRPPVFTVAYPAGWLDEHAETLAGLERDW